MGDAAADRQQMDAEACHETAGAGGYCRPLRRGATFIARDGVQGADVEPGVLPVERGRQFATEFLADKIG